MSVEKTRIYPINTGWLEADLGTYIFWKGAAGKKIWNPTLCFYVDTGEHKIMIDTGLCSTARHNCCNSASFWIAAWDAIDSVISLPAG